MTCSVLYSFVSPHGRRGSDQSNCSLTPTPSVSVAKEISLHIHICEWTFQSYWGPHVLGGLRLLLVVGYLRSSCVWGLCVSGAFVPGVLVSGGLVPGVLVCLRFLSLRSPCLWGRRISGVFVCLELLSLESSCPRGRRVSGTLVPGVLVCLGSLSV